MFGASRFEKGMPLRVGTELGMDIRGSVLRRRISYTLYRIEGEGCANADAAKALSGNAILAEEEKRFLAPIQQAVFIASLGGIDQLQLSISKMVEGHNILMPVD